VAVDKILKLNREVVVQDLNSQKVLNYLDQENSYSTAMQNSAWDCCAASGGKSILLYDKLSGKVRLTVSDIRENILANLRKRFQEAGISINRDFITDLARASGLPANENFSIIICDAPCTGSGTWARNPEQLFYFNAATIDSYAERQRKIVSNTIPHLKVGGLFFYITCSVFKKENEEIVDFILNSVSPAQPGCHLVLKHVAYLKGYEIAADNMFVAVFSKTNL
jgi:16S rRNA (cytosine967-C5)-methyltransferase